MPIIIIGNILKLVLIGVIIYDIDKPIIFPNIIDILEIGLIERLKVFKTNIRVK